MPESIAQMLEIRQAGAVTTSQCPIILGVKNLFVMYDIMLFTLCYAIVLNFSSRKMPRLFKLS